MKRTQRSSSPNDHILSQHLVQLSGSLLSVRYDSGPDRERQDLKLVGRGEQLTVY